MTKEYHDENTLFKVRDALINSGSTDFEGATEIIRILQNAGILFREMRNKKEGIDELYALLQECRDTLMDLEDCQRSLVGEFQVQVHAIQPVLESIRLAMDNTPPKLEPVDPGRNWKH